MSGWREQKKEELRERLYRTTLELFEAQGFEETSVQQIANLAQIGKGTFFNYFPSKDHVLVEWYRRVTLTALEKVENQAFSSTQKAFVALSDALAEGASSHPDLWDMKARRVFTVDLMLEGERTLDEQLLQFCCGHIEAGQTRGELNTKQDVRFFAEMFVTVLTGTAHSWVVSNHTFDIQQMMRKRIAFLFNQTK